MSKLNVRMIHQILDKARRKKKWETRPIQEVDLKRGGVIHEKL